MAKRKQLNIAQHSMLYLALCICGVLAYVALVNYPSQRAMDQFDSEIAKLQIQLEKQKVLFPVYQELFKQLKKPDNKSLPFPEATQLSKEHIGEIPGIFAEMASRNNLTADVIPDVKTIPAGSGILRVNATVQGDFFDFRNFLIELGGTPYLSHIEEIQVKPKQEFKEFAMKLWLALGE